MRALIVLFLFLSVFVTCAQSLELMPGTERTFADAQWLRTLDDGARWSLFSRTRATVDNEENTNLFTGAYLNYTFPSGLGGTVVGRIASAGAGSDVGLHLFKTSPRFMVYALASTEMSRDAGYSWFSILRFRPQLSARWNLFTAMELFSNFNSEGHVVSVQRLRLGLDKKGLQFGLGLNLSGLGRQYDHTDTNPGVFIRKEF